MFVLKIGRSTKMDNNKEFTTILNEMEELKEKYGDLYFAELAEEKQTKDKAEEAFQRSTETYLAKNHSFGDTQFGKKIVQSVYPLVSQFVRYELIKMMTSNVASKSYVALLYTMFNVFTKNPGEAMLVVKKLKAKRMSNDKIVASVDDIAPEVAKAFDSLTDIITAITINDVLDGAIKNVVEMEVVELIAQHFADETRWRAFCNTKCKNEQKLLKNYLEKRSNTNRHYRNDEYRETFKQTALRALLNRQNFELENWDSDSARELAYVLIALVVSIAGYIKKDKAGNDVKDENGKTVLYNYFEIYADKERGGNNIDGVRCLTVSNAFNNTFRNDLQKMTQNIYRYTPTVIPPKSWDDSLVNGGYYGVLAAKTILLRGIEGKTSLHKKYFDRKSDSCILKSCDLSNVIDAVNIAQATQWHVDEKILDVAQWVINEKLAEPGSEFAGLASGVAPQNKIKAELNKYKKMLDEATDEEQKIVLSSKVEEYEKRYKRSKKDYDLAVIQARSKNQRAVATISVAKRFAKYENIYFPMSLDFRGRLYCIPSFSYQGDQLQRGLLLMSTNGKTCQEEVAWNWLRISGSNKWGNDKVSFEDRIKFIDDMHDEIMSIAKDPKSNTLWADADEPFPFLQFCFEYAEAYTYRVMHNGSIVGYEGRGYRVEVDGSFNGLQHYSAAMRAPEGRYVNLTNSDKPSDMYQVVADKVTPRLKEIAEETTEDYEYTLQDDVYTAKPTKSAMARLWLEYCRRMQGDDVAYEDIKMNRKLTKGGVMLYVYGATHHGIANKSMKTIEDDYKKYTSVGLDKSCSIFTSLDIVEEIEKDGHKVKKASFDKSLAFFLGSLIYDAIVELVPTTNATMQVFRDWAKAVVYTYSKKVDKKTKAESFYRDTSTQNSVVRFSTPLGLSVQESYLEYKTESKQVMISVTGQNIRMYKINVTGKIDNKHSVSALPPNIVHSIDAAHCQLTILNSYNKYNVRHFCTIHDSYGALLADINNMRNCIRDSFVQLHSEHDIFEDIRKDLQSLTAEPLMPLPARNDLDLEEVKKSTYMFA